MKQFVSEYSSVQLRNLSSTSFIHYLLLEKKLKNVNYDVRYIILERIYLQVWAIASHDIYKSFQHWVVGNRP